MSPPRLGTAIRLGSYESGSPEWHAARRDRLGASEVAAAMGLSKWQSPFSLWHLKAGLLAPQRDNAQMQWGRDLETVIARRFAREHPEWTLSRCALYAHRERLWQVAQPDRVVHLGRRRLGALEVKTARYDDEWGEQGSDEVPLYYRCQALWQLDVFGWQSCHFAVLVTGSDYYEYAVEYHAGDVELMHTEALRFLASVTAGVPPDIDAHQATYAAVRQLHPDIDAELEVELDEELAQTYSRAVAGERAATEAKRQATSRVLAAMGTARRALCNGEQVALRVPSPRGAPPHLRPARQGRKAKAA
jgi:putative phage-type endonuclease